MKQRMILLHGLFGDLSNWTTVVQHFKDRYEVIVPELPLLTIYNLDDLADEIYPMANPGAILIGNSLGGHVAIRFAHRYPHLVKAIVLTGSSGLYENLQAGSFLKRANYQYLKQRVATTFYDTELATDELVKQVMQITTDTEKCRAIIKIAKVTQRDKVDDILPQINAPALLIWGQQDEITPPNVALQFATLLPKASLVMLDQCGHAPMMERPIEFNDALDQFLC